MRKLVKISVVFILAIVASFSVMLANQVQAKETQIVDTKKIVEFDGILNELSDAVPYYVNYGLEGDKSGILVTLDFSKASNRRIILKYRNMFASLSSKKASAALFGKSTSNAAATISGDWGDIWPNFSKTKYYQVSNKKYKIVFDLEMISEWAGTTENVATITMYLKTASKSSLGYNLTKMEIEYK